MGYQEEGWLMGWELGQVARDVGIFYEANQV